MKKMMKSSISRYFLPCILSKVGYLDDKMYVYTLDGENISLKPCSEGFLPWVTILSRQHYSESQKYLPFDDAKQVAKYFKTTNRNAKQELRQMIVSRDAGGTYYNEWCWEKSLSISLLTIPETVLIASGKQAFTQITRNERTFWCIKTAKGVISSFRNSLLNSSNRFCDSIGIGNVEPVALAENEVLKLSIYQLLENFHKIASVFFCAPSSEQVLRKSRDSIKLLSATVVVYFLLTSAYLLCGQWYFDNKISQLGSDVNSALIIQTELDSQELKYKGIQALSRDLSEHRFFWLLMSDIFNKAEFSNIRFTKSGRYELRGQADQASELLSYLIEKKNVSGARFDYPTRRNNNKEVFVISFFIISDVIPEGV